MSSPVSRRSFLQLAGVGAGGALLSACAPQVVKETVVVEKEVEKIVKETVIVEGEAKVVERVVTKVVEKEATPAPPEPKSIRFQSHWFVSGNTAIWPSIIDAFHEKNPDITVELVEVKAVHETVMTSIAGGNAPEVIQWNFGIGEVSELAARAALLPIDNLLETSSIDMDEYLPVQWEHKEWGGNTWGTPVGEGGVTQALTWHKRYFADAGLDTEDGPDDWPTMLEYTKKLTKYDDAGNISIQGWDPWDSGHWKPGSWVMYMDSLFISEDKRTMMLDQGNWAQVLQIYADVYQELGVEQMTSFNEIWRYFIGNEKCGFPAGTRAMILNGSWQPGVLKRSMVDQSWEIGYDWAPQVNGKKYCAFGDSHTLVMPRTTKDPDTAFRFMEYCCSLEANLVAFNARGACVWSKSLLDHIDISPYPGLDFYFGMLDEADKVWGPKEFDCPIMGQLNSIWKRAGEEAVHGTKTAEQACIDANAELQDALDSYWAAEERK